MPTMMGMKKKQQQLCEPAAMSEVFRSVHKKYNLPPGDFPEMKKFLSVARELNFSDFPRVEGSRLKNGKLLEELDKAMSQDIPRLLESMPGMANQGNISTKAAAYSAEDEIYK
jgi:EH domain-containing protein 1